MSITLAAALLASTPVLPACSWDNPGHNPYTGNVVAAVDRYTDIPSDIRAALKEKMSKHKYDDIATIRRDSILGSKEDVSYTDLRDMHFGPATICRSVTREKWSIDAVERGLVYCEKEHCIIVPTVCRNVSRVTYRKKERPIETKTAITTTVEEVPVTIPPPPTLKVENPPKTFENVAGQQLQIPNSYAQSSFFGGFTSSTVVVVGFTTINNTTTTITNNTTNNTTDNTTHTHEHKPHDHVPTVPDTPVTPIPEPSTWALIMIGLVLMWFFQRRRNKLYS